jgi:peptidyl-prolyl cis-trans isomerase A (cyclophilin A)
MAQAGYHGNPRVTAAWRGARIKDDPVTQPLDPGTVTFAMGSEPNSRSAQFFVSYRDNNYLKDYGAFAPIGKVIEGLETVNALYSGYGEGAPRGTGPDQRRLALEGNSYLEAAFPNLDYIKRTVLLESSQ